MKAAGMKGVLLVAKHHGGFCLWPTSTTPYSVKSCPWRGGKGDMVREFADAAREAGLKFGVYNSPWDRNDADYGNEKYIARFYEQLRELHTNYGELFISWYDGANGGDGYYGGAREMRRLDLANYYGWDKVTEMIRKWQPDAVMFNIEDIRWVGNESGFAGDPCWATYDPAPEGGKKWNPTNGQRNGQKWMPAECDVPIRPGWFYHPAQDEMVKNSKQLFDLYFQSVGRGQALDIGLALDKRGLLHDNDVKALEELGSLLNATFADNIAANATISANNTRQGYLTDYLTDNDKTTYWATDDEVTEGEITLEWSQPQRFNIISIREELPLGQRIDSVRADYFSDGQWLTFGQATSIGANRLLRGKALVEATKLRIHTFGPVCPALSELGVFSEPNVEVASAEKSNKIEGAIEKTEWKLVPAADDRRAFDDDVATVWVSTDKKNELIIDLGESVSIGEFVYTPPTEQTSGLVSRYELYLSDKPDKWGKPLESGEFGNIRNNPIPQMLPLAKPVTARYLRFKAAATDDDAAMSVAEIDVIPHK
jgi:alpha-L-fucosidase